MFKLGPDEAKRVVCFGRQAESAAQSLRMGKGSQKMSLGKSSPGLKGMGQFTLWLGCQEKLNSTSTPDHALYRWFGRVKTPIASFSCVLSGAAGNRLTHRAALYCRLFAVAIHGSLKLLYSTGIKLENKSQEKSSCEAYKTVMLENQMKNWLHVLNAF